MPFIISMLVIIHLIFLHEEKSNNPLGLSNIRDKIFFFPYFSRKDISRAVLILFLFLIISLQYPYLLMDPDNFTPANPIVTPTHIQPEWYFLFAYAILRAIPNKLGGVIMLVISILIMFTRNLKTIKFHFSKISYKTQTFW